MTPEQKAREIIDKKLVQSGWIVQDMKQLNLFAGLGVAVREFPTSPGPVDYALFVEGTPVGIIEAKKDELGENITAVEGQSNRYVNSTFKWIKGDYRIRFVYEATGKLTRFTDYDDIKYRSRTIFSFHQPQELQRHMKQPDTIRNRMKRFPDFDTTGFRKCQISAIGNLEKSFADNKPKALIQMATGAGKTFTAITTVYRLLKHTGVNRVLFLVDTKGLGEQAEREFLAYRPNDDNRSFSELYGVRRLKLNLQWSTFISPISQSIAGNFASSVETAHPFRVEADSIMCAFTEYTDFYDAARKTIEPAITKYSQIWEKNRGGIQDSQQALLYMGGTPEYEAARNALMKALYWEIGQYSLKIVVNHGNTVSNYKYTFSVSETEREKLEANVNEIMNSIVLRTYGIQTKFQSVQVAIVATDNN